MKTQRLPIASLQQAIDVRRQINDDHVLYLAGLVEGGTKLPPPKITIKTLRILDGRHRIAAADLLGYKDILVELVPEREEKDLYFAAFEANVGGSLQPTTTDITHTIKRLMDLKVSTEEIIRRLPFPAAVSRKYIGYVRGNENRDRTVRALEGIREGKITLPEAAKKYGVSITTLKKALDARAGKLKANLGSLKSVITRRYRGAGSATGKTIKQIFEMLDNDDWSVDQAREFMEHVDKAINSLKKTHQNHMSRFLSIYGER